MQRLRTSRATTPSRGFITRAASALIFIGATALAFALPGDAAERNSLTPSFSEWRESGSPASAEENGHWLGADVGTFRITRGDALHDRIFRAVQDRVHQEPEKAAREVHSLVVGDAAGREKLRQMLLNAAEGKEMVSALDLDSWWQSYTDSYLLDLADAGVNEILQYSEERMLARLGFVKNVNLEYRTPLGGRTGYGALSFLGALSEKEDSVVAWQLRASHNEDAESGLSAGLIFRHARDKFSEGDLLAGHPMLLGLNAFLDYETHAAGNFLRYSVGGEIRTGALDFYGNYYIPLSDTKEHEGLAYYSAEGFDVEANVGVPGADWLSGVVGYYWWEGEGALADEEGTKFGFRARPNTSWEFEFEYDLVNEGDQEIGGRLSYTRQIGDQPSFNVSSRPFGGNFNPRNHFYDVVRREYAQRIRSYVAGPSDPVIIPMASTIPGMVEFSGVVTLASADVTLETTYPIVGTSTVQVSGGDAVIGLGFGSNVPSGTVGLVSGGEYVFDTGAQAIIVRSGGLYWDDPSAGWARNVGDDGGSTVLLFGTGFTVEAASNAISDFVLYEGRGDAHAVGDPDPLVAGVSMDCSQGSATSATAGEGRVRTGTYTTECYGDLATDSTGANFAIGGTALEADKDYPNPTEAELSVSGAAMLTMRGGRGVGGESVEISFGAAGAVRILNDVAGGIRYVKTDSSGFSINGAPVGCSGTILANVGGVAAYCPQALAEFVAGEGGSVGIASAGFASGSVLTVTSPFSGVDMSFTLVTAPAGFSVDGNGVISAADINGLTEGRNNVEMIQNFGVIAGVSELPESRILTVNVHQLSGTGRDIVVLINNDNADAFANGNKIGFDSLGFEIENAVVTGADDAGLSGSGVTYDAGSNEFSIANQLTVTASYQMTVTVTGDNVRGTHTMIVNVEVVDRIVIGASELVVANENVAAGGSFGGNVGLAAGLEKANASGNVTFGCRIVSGDGFSTSPSRNGCSLNLTTPLGDDASRVAQVEVTHSPTGAYETQLLAPFGGEQPDGSGNEVPDTLLTANITVWKAEPGAAQDKSTNSTPPADGRDAANVAATFDLPANPSGSGIDFATGGMWSAVGALEEELVIDSASGEVRGSPYDRNGDPEGEYTLMLTASFKHPSLGGDLEIVMNLLVVDFTAPATIVLSPGANGQLVAYASGSSLTADGGTVTVASKTVVEVVAIPAPGYLVSAWTESGVDTAGCVSNGGVGEGGRKSCTFTAGNDKDYGIAVEFASGALPADLFALASEGVNADNPFPADRAVLEAVCRVLGGTVNSGQCEGAYNAAMAPCAFVDVLSNQIANGTCYGGGVEAFKNILVCNRQNMIAADRSATCGATCGAGETAVGGACQTAANAVITYAQPSKGTSTGSGLQVFRAYGDFEGVIGSGEGVPQGVWLSLRAAPGTGHFVSDWVGCNGGETGNFTEVNTVKSCLTFVDFGTSSLEFAVSLRAENSDFAKNYPLPLSGVISSLDITDDVCEDFGGTADDYGNPLRPIVECLDYAPNQSCLHVDRVAHTPTCAAAFTMARACNLQGLLMVDSTSCNFAEKCDTGYPLAGNCSDGSAPVPGLPDHIDPSEIRDGRYRGLTVPVGFRDGVGDFFFRAALNDSAVGGNAGVWGGSALPDLHPGLVTLEGGHVANTNNSCTQFGGRLISAPVGVGANYCVGIAEAGFCVVSPAGTEGVDNRLGFRFNCGGDGKMYNTVRDCNVQNKPAASSSRCATEVCPDGLEARGMRCIVVAESGEEAETLTIGEAPMSLTYADPPDNTIVEGTSANCERFGGRLVSAPVGVGENYCVGAAAAGFCVVSPAGTEGVDNRLGFRFNCEGSDKMFNKVLECNLENKPAASSSGCANNVCEGGRIARGAECVAPPAATDGVFIVDPNPSGEERGALTSGTLTVGLNEVPAGMITVKAVPAAGYHVAEWLNDCGGGVVAEASPFRPEEQSCVLTKKADEGLRVGVRFEYGLLDYSIPVTATVIAAPTGVMCAGLGGTLRMTLGAGSGSTAYCDGFNQKNPAASGGNQRDAEDENIEDQCWISGGFIGTDTDDSLEGNIQRCHSAFVVARECNKLNMRSVSILPKPTPSNEECDAGSGPEVCAPQAFARGVGNLAASGLCGEECGDGMIAQGGNCITADQAKTRFADPN